MVSSRPKPQTAAADTSRDQAQSSERVHFTDAAVQSSGYAEPARPFAVGEGFKGGWTALLVALMTLILDPALVQMCKTEAHEKTQHMI